MRRRIYELLPDVPDEAVPLLLGLIERAATGADVTALLAQVGNGIGG